MATDQINQLNNSFARLANHVWFRAGFPVGVCDIDNEVISQYLLGFFFEMVIDGDYLGVFLSFYLGWFRAVMENMTLMLRVQ